MSELLTITAFSKKENICRDYFRKIVNYNNLMPVRVTTKGYKHYKTIELKALFESYKSCKTLNQLVDILKQGKNTIKLAIDVQELKPFYVTENEIKYYFPNEVKNALEQLNNYKSLTEMSKSLDIGPKLLKSLITIQKVIPAYTKGKSSYYRVPEVIEMVDDFKKYKTIGELCVEFEVSRSKIESILESKGILPRYFGENKIIQYYKPEVIKDEINRYKQFLNLKQNKQIKSIFQICDELGIGKTHYNAILAYKSILPLISYNGFDYYNIEEIELVVNETSNTSDLAKHLDLKPHQVNKIVDEYNILSCYTVGDIKYYINEEVKEVAEKWKEVRSNLGMFVTTSGLGEKYNLDGRKIGRTLNNLGINPICIVGGIKYYEEVSTLAAIDMLQNIGKYQSLNEIALEMKACAKTLLKAVELAEVEPEYRMKLKRTNKSLEKGAREFIDYYDKERVIYALEETRKNVDKQMAKDSKNQGKFYPLIHVELQQLLDEYIEYRKAGRAVNYNNFSTNKKINNLEKQLKIIKGWLSSALYKIGLSRLTINNDELETPIYFDIYTLNVDDFEAIKKGFKPTSRQTLFHNIRPFLYFILKNKKTRLKNIEEYLSFNSLELQFEDFLNLFPKNEEEIEDVDNQEELPKRINKSFLTREQIIDVYNLLLSDPRSNDPLKNATMWLIACVTGLRPEELLNLRIEHFELDEIGLLKVNARGWGVLRFPKEMSKQKLKGSHKIFGTPISSYTIHLINKYLLWVYKNQGNTRNKGYGWFFRPLLYLPEKKYKSISNQFIGRIREQLIFLEKEQAQDFVKKASRHSMNNLFVESFYVIPDKELKSKLEIARQHHMRHKGKNEIDNKIEDETLSQARTGREYYTADISIDAYYNVLEYVVGYPWDKQELILWEMKQGFRSLNEELTTFLDNPEEQGKFEQLFLEEKKKQMHKKEIIQKEKINSNNKLIKQLQWIEGKLLEIKHPPNSKNLFDQWRKEVVRLNQEKEKIQSYLKSNSS